MKAKPVLLRLGLAAGCILLAFGCRKPQTAREAPITGRPSDPPLELTPRWQPNKRYTLYQEIYQSTGTEWERTPSTPPMEVSIDLGLLITTTNAPGGNVGLEMEVLSLAAEVTTGERFGLRYDSLNKAAPNEGAGLELFEGIAGTRIRLLVGPNNRVLQVDGLRELRQHIESVTASAFATGRQRTMRAYSGWAATIARLLSDPNSYRQMVEFSGWPGKAVKVGESWSLLRQWPGLLGGQATLSAKHTLKGWQEREGRKCARVEITENIGTLARPAGRVASGQNMRMENVPASGTVWFDPALGFPVESVFQRGYHYSGVQSVSPPRRGTNAPPTNAAPIMQKFSNAVSQRVAIRLSEVSSLEPPPPAP
jgi:hypothetical protein